MGSEAGSRLSCGTPAPRTPCSTTVTATLTPSCPYSRTSLPSPHGHRCMKDPRAPSDVPAGAPVSADGLGASQMLWGSRPPLRHLSRFVFFPTGSLVPTGHRPGLSTGGASGVGEPAQRGWRQLLL